MIQAASETPQHDRPYEDMSEVRGRPPGRRRQPDGPHPVLPVLQGEKIVFEYFSEAEFVEQLVAFLSLEERKGKDSFNPRRFCLFKVRQNPHLARSPTWPGGPTWPGPRARTANLAHLCLTGTLS